MSLTEKWEAFLAEAEAEPHADSDILYFSFVDRDTRYVTADADAAKRAYLAGRVRQLETGWRRKHEFFTPLKNADPDVGVALKAARDLVQLRKDGEPLLTLNHCEAAELRALLDQALKYAQP
jgi:hypothetical protein